MRILIINGTIVDIDEKTSIGIDFQAYDISNPANRKTTVSNNFSIPITAANMALLGFPGNPQSTNKTFYNKLICNYYVGSVRLINNGTARITSVTDRINFFVFEKEEFWDTIKDYKWPDFISDFLAWTNVPKFGTPFTGSYSDFVQSLIDANENITLKLFIGNLSLYVATAGSYLEDTSSIYLKYNTSSVNALGGHLSIYYKSIFLFIKDKFGIDFMVDSSEAGNIFNDEIASQMFCPARTLSINPTLDNTGFYILNDESGLFKPDDSTKDKSDKTLYALISSFFQHFNIILDQRGDKKYFLARFDDINKADVVDFSGKLSGNYEFYPIIDGWNQNNYIKFASVPEGVDALTNSKKIVCNNKTLDAGSSDEPLLEIDAAIPKYVYIGGAIVPLLDDGESFKTFHFFVNGQNSSINVKMVHNGVTYSAIKTLKLAALYSLSGEYNTLVSMMSYPVKYIQKKYLELQDVHNIKYFKRYYIKELNGTFFLNKISGFNPDKSNEATSLELIKIQ